MNLRELILSLPPADSGLPLIGASYLPPVRPLSEDQDEDQDEDEDEDQDEGPWFSDLTRP